MFDGFIGFADTTERARLQIGELQAAIRACSERRRCRVVTSVARGVLSRTRTITLKVPEAAFATAKLSWDDGD